MVQFDRTHPVSRETNVWDYLPYPTEFFSPLPPEIARREYANIAKSLAQTTMVV